MFVHVLLFSLLGTSVVSLPVIPYQPAYQDDAYYVPPLVPFLSLHYEHIPSWSHAPYVQLLSHTPFLSPHDPHDVQHTPLWLPHGPHPVQPSPPYSSHWSLAQVLHDESVHRGPDTSRLEKGKESDEPILVPVSLHRAITLSSPQKTLLLDNFVLYADRWYREPTNDVEYALRNDIMQILPDLDETGIGIVVFHTMGESPGEVIPQHILLTPENRHRLVGTWRRMPSAYPILRNDVMMVWEAYGLLHYVVQYGRQGMRVHGKTSLRIGVSFGLPTLECVGTWVRAPEKHTPEEFVNDVAVVQPSSQIDIHVMSVTSGLAGPKLEHFNRDRLVGIWYRVLCAEIMINHRLDQMVVESIGGRLAFHVDREEVLMLGEVKASLQPTSMHHELQ